MCWAEASTWDTWRHARANRDEEKHEGFWVEKWCLVCCRNHWIILSRMAQMLLLEGNLVLKLDCGESGKAELAK